VKARCYLRELRGRRGLREIAKQCGVNAGTLSTIETGRSLPKDKWIDAMEAAYGAPFSKWYPEILVRGLEPDDADPIDLRAAQ
jgi:transcriptional regulator with XRE-family HTH domain